jgi:hypothetical protein
MQVKEAVFDERLVLRPSGVRPARPSQPPSGMREEEERRVQSCWTASRKALRRMKIEDLRDGMEGELAKSLALAEEPEEVRAAAILVGGRMQRPQVPPTPTIPERERTIPMTIIRAAKLMGYTRTRSSDKAAKILSRAIKGGEIPAERLGRQQYIFSRKSFPLESQREITPK